MDIDFLGVLKGDPINVRKKKIIEVYRCFFRFSVERIKILIDSPIMMSIVLEYLRQTRMERVFKSATLIRNKE